jgi:6-phosphogluconate dehydrogenase
MTPIISIIAIGAMGGGVAQKLTESGATVLTHLEGRSERTRMRAQDAGVADASIKEIVQRSDFILSILPPRDAFTLAQTISQELASHPRVAEKQLIYADCNAVNDITVRKIAELFKGTSGAFVDASIIGGPPKGPYNPTFYASVDPGNRNALESFVNLSSLGLHIKALDGEGARVGDASALKMSYAVGDPLGS